MEKVELDNGNIQLYLGDCLEVMPKMKPGIIDSVIVDLPYGTTSCAWDVILPFDALWSSYRRLVKPNSALVFTANQPFTSLLVSSNLTWFRYEWIWDKGKPTGYQMANSRPMKRHENICVFSPLPATHSKAGSMYYFPQGLIEKKRVIKRTHKFTATDDGGKLLDIYEGKYTGYPSTIISLYNNDRNRVHPTQKPVALMEYLIKTYTNPGDLVLDNTMGSGTTGVAAINTNRRFIGIEKEEKYFEIAVQRCKDALENLTK